MSKRAVFHLVSMVTLVIGVAMALCSALSYYWADPVWAQQSLLYASIITAVFAIILLLSTRGDINLSRRDGFAVVTLGWIFAAIFGALPYILSGVIPHPVAAIFETMSGFTTTGASVLPAGEFQTLESIPRGILFWRALTHWFGGMGVLVLCVAILPFLGVGGMQLYRAEMPGPSKDRLTPRITTTAKLLWGVYALLTLVEILLLKFGAACAGSTPFATRLPPWRRAVFRPEPQASPPSIAVWWIASFSSSCSSPVSTSLFTTTR